jgi:hypothetical protein
VKKFNGTSWNPVGTATVSAGRDYFVKLALGATGTPYVAYMAGGYAGTGEVTVRKFNGTSWSSVGTTGFWADQFSLALGAADTPYVAYKDAYNVGASCDPQKLIDFKCESGHAGRLTVQKFDGTSWSAVGIAGFTAGGANHPSLALDATGTPYVAYMDEAHSGKVTVQKFDGTRWSVVGAAGFAGEANYVSLALGATGTLYVAYDDVSNSFKATVQKFDGTRWSAVGTSGFSAGETASVSLALSASGTPYVAYSDDPWKGSGKVTVKKFNGTSWIPVGVARFSAGLAEDISLALSTSGTPYVAYQGYTNPYDTDLEPQTPTRNTVQKFA